jgi:hypothetical protein
VHQSNQALPAFDTSVDQVGHRDQGKTLSVVTPRSARTLIRRGAPPSPEGRREKSALSIRFAHATSPLGTATRGLLAWPYRREAGKPFARSDFKGDAHEHST